MGNTVEKSPIKKQAESKEAADPEEVKRKTMAQFAPKSESDYKAVLTSWIGRFFMNHIKEEAPKKQKCSYFQIEWGHTTGRLSADVEGDMTKAIMDSHKILNCEWDIAGRTNNFEEDRENGKPNIPKE